MSWKRMGVDEEWMKFVARVVSGKEGMAALCRGETREPAICILGPGLSAVSWASKAVQWASIARLESR